MTPARAAAQAPGPLVEAATWVPIETVLIGPWRAGLSGGFTRRANSVLPLGEVADLVAALDEVEALYASRGLPAVVRVPGPASSAPLERALHARGYRTAARTEVLVLDLDDRMTSADRMALDDRMAFDDRMALDDCMAFDDRCVERPGATSSPPRLVVAAEPDDAWLGGWLAVKAAGADRALARRVVSGSPASYLTAYGPAGVLGVLRAAWAPGWVGLSCLMVDPAARRRGLGRALTLAALGLARSRGIGRAFLQVEAANTTARLLYEGVGFVRADAYAYAELPLADVARRSGVRPGPG